MSSHFKCSLLAAPAFHLLWYNNLLIRRAAVGDRPFDLPFRPNKCETKGAVAVPHNPLNRLAINHHLLIHSSGQKAQTHPRQTPAHRSRTTDSTGQRATNGVSIVAVSKRSLFLLFFFSHTRSLSSSTFSPSPTFATNTHHLTVNVSRMFAVIDFLDSLIANRVTLFRIVSCAKRV